tara:strand:+ start:692 stop:1156 length:465 start_codon:yes stop_codon:yes gene_type:complete
MKKKSLQETYAPKGICFGCGCLNDNGLKIKSFVNNNTVVCAWLPQKYHEAFPGVLNGGIIGSILDCHSNWAAAFYLMKSQNLKTTPCTVTADYSIKLKKPTPSDRLLTLSAELISIKNNVAKINAHLLVDDILFASCLGTFVAVDSSHPAYHRW